MEEGSNNCNAPIRTSYHTPHKAKIKHHPADGRSETMELFLDDLKLRCVTKYNIKHSGLLNEYVLELNLIVELNSLES